MSDLPPVISRELALSRLEMIFPRNAFDAVYSSPAAAATVAVMLYVGAVYDKNDDVLQQRYVRPTTIVWMRERALDERTAEDQRHDFYEAALGTGAEQAVTELMATWGIHAGPWYKSNTRETIRDDVLRRWLDEGPVLERPGLASSSPTARWVLRASFAALFDPRLVGEDLEAAIDVWIKRELSATAKIRLQSVRQHHQLDHAVYVSLPDGSTRQLEPGPASQIIKGVIEQWATRALGAPMLLAISEPGQKEGVIDTALLRRVGLKLDPARLLPDVLIADADADPVQIWVVEIVHSDGEINESRKRQLVAWGAEHGIVAEQMQFLTAFASRASLPARRRLKDLASGTHGWYADEPEHMLWFGRIPTRG